MSLLDMQGMAARDGKAAEGDGDRSVLSVLSSLGVCRASAVSLTVCNF